MQGKDMPVSDAMSAVYVGVDVCKDWLDVHVHPQGLRLRVGNDRLGLRRLKKTLAGLSVARVVMEATGKYHRAAQRSLHAAGLAVAVVDPRRARLLAQAIGQHAKTDAIDARFLATMGAMVDPPAREPPPRLIEHLAELVAARRAATADRTALSNRLTATTIAFLRTELRRMRASTERHIRRLDAAIAQLVESDPDLARRHAILCSIPGIGTVTAATFLAGLSELGQASAKQLAMLVGVAPIANDSGDRTGQRKVRGGRRAVRDAAYMAALSASRYNPALASFAARLKAAGKPAKLVLVAVMRKLVVLANTLIAGNRLWTPNPP